MPEQSRIGTLVGDLTELRVAEETSDPAIDAHITRLRGIWGSDDGQVRHHLYRRVHGDVRWITGDDDRAHAAALRAVARVQETPDITDAEVDAAARSIYDVKAGRLSPSWDAAPLSTKSAHRRLARVALVAATLAKGGAAMRDDTAPAAMLPASTASSGGEMIGWCPRCRDGLGRADGNGGYTCDRCGHTGPDQRSADERRLWAVDPTDAAMVEAQPGGPDHPDRATTDSEHDPDCEWDDQAWRERGDEPWHAVPAGIWVCVPHCAIREN